MSPTEHFLGRFFIYFKALGSLSEHRVVSKPQVLSKLRYVDIVRRVDETREERAYRDQYDSLQEWNNRYWAEHNELFNREKENYILREFGEDRPRDEALSHDQLAPFYRGFLERNRDKHVEYNRRWYKNHIALILGSFRAKVSRLKAKDINPKKSL